MDTVHVSMGLPTPALEALGRLQSTMKASRAQAATNGIALTSLINERLAIAPGSRLVIASEDGRKKEHFSLPWQRTSLRWRIYWAGRDWLNGWVAS